MKRVRGAIPFAVKTAIYKYIITCVERDWHSFTSPAEGATAVDALRAKIAPKCIMLPEQMEATLAAWHDGSKIAELDAARTSAQQRGATTPAPQIDATMSASQSGAHTSAPQRDVTTSAPQSGATSSAPQIGEKLGLAARLASATRRRIA